MKKPLSEIEKLAAQGPLSVFAGSNGTEVGTVEAGCVFSCKHTPPWDGLGRPDCQKRTRANAALLAHWFNHGPKLLARLHEVLTDWQEGFRPNEVTSYQRGLDDVKNASEVET